jgi:hypothetical protein
MERDGSAVSRLFTLLELPKQRRNLDGPACEDALSNAGVLHCQPMLSSLCYVNSATK